MTTCPVSTATDQHTDDRAADIRYAASMDAIKSGDFADVANALDLDPSDVALEMIEDLFAAIKAGNPLQAQLALAKLTTDMNAMMSDAAETCQ